MPQRMMPDSKNIAAYEIGAKWAERICSGTIRIETVRNMHNIPHEDKPIIGDFRFSNFGLAVADWRQRNTL